MDQHREIALSKSSNFQTIYVGFHGFHSHRAWEAV